MKDNKGITLIALVITIIVLLILAGVSIATLTGENGLLTRANEAKISTVEGTIRDAVSVAVSNIRIDNYKENPDNPSAVSGDIKIGETSTLKTILGDADFKATMKGYTVTNTKEINLDTPGTFTVSGGKLPSGVTLTVTVERTGNIKSITK